MIDYFVRASVRQRALRSSFPMLALALCMAGGSALNAQPRAMIQAVPSAGAVERLNQNLGRLSRSPQDVQALLGAGYAALDLGDVQAANGFFTRANMVAPRNGEVKLGLAIVSIALKQATEAATYFDEAAALGVSAQDHLSDRGLAYDLTGQQAKAQQDYQAALRTNPSDATLRTRYAASLGISGRVADAEAQLQPALAAQDREAWRVRAFVLAMNGRVADARKITQTVMPKGLSDALDPYISRLPMLSAGQKAAAVHFGDFPSNVLRMAASTPAPVERAEPAAAAAPRQTRLSRREREKLEAEQRAEASRVAEAAKLAAAQPAPPPFREEPKASVTSAVPTQVATQSTATPRRPFTPATPPPVRTAAVVPAPTTQTERRFEGGTASARPAETRSATPPPAAASTAPGFSAEAASAVRTAGAPATQGPTDPIGTTATAQPTPVANADPAPAGRSLADVMASLDVSETEQQSSTAAVDLAAVARIQAERKKAQEAVAAKAAAEKTKRDAAAKAKAEAAEKAKAEAAEKARLAANPARTWVQVATGRDVSALAFDLRRLRRTYADAFGTEAGWTAEWGATKRLLIGPFTAAKARDVTSAIKKSGGDAFVWSSEAGEDVVKIGAK